MGGAKSTEETRRRAPNPCSPFLVFCDSLGAPAWYFARDGATLIAGNDEARRWRKRLLMPPAAPTSQSVFESLVLGDRNACRRLSAADLLEVCERGSIPARKAGWFCDHPPAWRPVFVNIIGSAAPAKAARSGIYLVVMSRAETPRGETDSPFDAPALRRQIADAAHDLNNLAASVRGFAELGLDSKFAPEEPISGYLQDILIMGRRLSWFADSLRGFGPQECPPGGRFSAGAWVAGDLPNAPAVDVQGGVSAQTILAGGLSCARSAIACALTGSRLGHSGVLPSLRLRPVSGRGKRCASCGSPLADQLMEVLVPFAGLERFPLADPGREPSSRAQDRDRCRLLAAAVDCIHRAGGHTGRVNDPSIRPVHASRRAIQEGGV